MKSTDRIKSIIMVLMMVCSFIPQTVFAADGNYKAGSASYSLAADRINIEECTAVLSTDSFTYDGTAKSPDVTVKEWFCHTGSWNALHGDLFR